MPFGPQPNIAPATDKPVHPFVQYGTPKDALKRFTELQRLPRRLTPEERIERDLIGGAFADVRNVLNRFDSICL